VTDRDPINLTGLPPDDINDLGLRIDLNRGFSFTHGKLWQASVSRRQETASGREGKPKKLLTLVSRGEETPADLLRQLAVVLEHPEPIEFTDDQA
jgi:hypothetical protein